MAQSLATDSMHPAGKLPPTLTPTGHFSGKPTLPISRSVTLIGSRKQARLQLISSSVSTNHALIVNADSGPYIRDLASREHTLVNGIEVNEGPLSDGDEITIGRFSFRFNASPHTKPIEEVRRIRPAEAAQITVEGADLPVPFDGKSILIGRRDGCDIKLLEDTVSTTHAIIFEMDGRRWIRDLVSRTGTFVNGRQIRQVELNPGDEIKCGETEMRYVTDGVASTFASPPRVARGAGVGGGIGAATADLGADLHDLEPAMPIEPAAGPAGTDALELVQDEAAEVEPVEAAADGLGLEPLETADTAGGRAAAPAPLDFELEAEPELTPLPVDEAPADAVGVEPVAEDDLLAELGAPAPAAPQPVEHRPPPTPMPLPVGEAEDDEVVDLATVVGSDADETSVSAAAVADAPAEPAEPPEPVEPVEIEAFDFDVAASEQPGEVEIAQDALTASADTAPAPADDVAEADFDINAVPDIAEPRDEAPAPAAAEAEMEAFADAPTADEAVDALAMDALETPASAEAAAPQADEAIDFTADFGAEHDTLPPETLAAIEDSVAAGVAPLPLDETEADDISPPESLAAFEDAGAMDTLELAGPADETIVRSEADIAAAASAAAAAAAAAGADATLPLKEPKQRRRRRKKGEEGEAAPESAAVDESLDLETPEPAAPPAPEPSRVAPPGVSQWHLDPVTESELIAPTEATPESALDLDDAVAAGEAAAAGRLHEVELTDSSFGKAVEDFTGHSTGSIVEAPAGEAEPELRPQSSSEPVTLEAIETVEGVHDDSMPSASSVLDVEAELRDVPAEPPDAEQPTAEAEVQAEELALSSTAADETAEDALAAAAIAEIAPAEPAQRDEAARPSAAIDDQAALELLASDTVAQSDSPGLTMDEDRALRRREGPPEPLLPADAVAERDVAAPPSELAPPESAADAAADDRLFDLDLEPLAAEGAKELDPRFSVHPEDLDGSVAGIDAARGEAATAADADAEIFELDTPSAVAEEETPAAADGTPDTIEGFDVLDAEPPPPTIPPTLPGAEAAAAAEAADVEVEDVEVELEPVSEAPAATPSAEAPSAEAPTAEAPTAEAPPTPPAPAAAPTQQQAPPPQQPPRQQSGRPTPVEAFNWGANQEHFFGGLPLNLGGPTPRAPQQQQQPQPPRPAPARQQPQQQQIPPQARQSQRAAPQQPQFPQRPPQKPQQQQRGRPSPFADGGRGVASGFEGLAVPPNDSDVFAQAPGSLTAGFDPSLMNDVFGGPATIGRNNKPAGGAGAASGGRTMPTPQPGATRAATADPAAARPPASMRATKAEPPGDAWTGSGPLSGDVDQTDPTAAAQDGGTGTPQPPLPSAEEAPPQPTRKKRRWFGLKVLVPFALVSMAAAGAAIYTFVPVKSSVAGTLKFENFEKLPQHNRREFVKPQLALLTDPSRTLRESAKRRLTALNKTATPGFLDDSLIYAKVATPPVVEGGSGANFDIEAGTLSLKYVGGASRADQDRMFALLQAVYDHNKRLVDETNDLTRTVESLTRERAELERSMKEMKARIDELATAAQQKPDVAERSRLEAEAQRLEQAWKVAVANVTRLTQELKQLRENAPAPAPAPQASAASVDADPTLQQLQVELQNVNQKLAALHESRGVSPQAARQNLEAAGAALGTQLQQAQQAAQGNDALVAYLTRAQEALQRTGAMAEELVARQQQQAGELANVNQQLNEKVQARRAEMAKKDPELVKLMDQRDFRTRQHNAAVGQGLTKEAADLKVELSALDTEIAARQTLVPDDGASADAIAQLQRLAESTQRNLEADRAGVVQQLDQLQQETARARPANDTMSAAQQAATAEVEKRLAAVAAAGRQYASSASPNAGAANPAVDEQMRALQVNATQLAGNIQARLQELAAQPAAAAAAPAANPQAAIEQKERELAAAEKTRADAEAAYFAANKKVHELKQRTEQARAAGEQRDALARKRDIAQQNLDQLVNQYELKKKLAEQQTFPAAPTATSLKVDDQGDPRPMYTLIACGAIAALCVGLGFLKTTSGGAADDYSGYPMYNEAHAHDPNQTVAYEDEHERATPVEV